MSALGKILIGAMSGTSADGVDVAAVSISGRGVGMTAQLLQFVHVDYPAELKKAIFAARATPAVSWAEVAGLTRQVSEKYAEAVNRINADHRSAAAAIAAHGQTFFHDPPNTLQLLDPALLAARTGLSVVSDFRRADCAAGGQGAPLVPFADYVLFRHPTKNRVLLNIGGIANLTWLRAGGTIDEVIAFDTGPGNCVSDWLCREQDPSGPGFDAGGAMALTGKVNEAICQAALADAYLHAPPPKSTDTAAMIQLFERARAGRLLSFQDQLATACAITARAIASSLSLYSGRGRGRGSLNLESHVNAKDQGDPLPNPLPEYKEREAVTEILASGGGILNARLLNELRNALDRNIMLSVLPDEMAQAKEAVAFALLAAATLDGEPSNVPSVTGAARRVILGSITPKP